MEKKCIICNSSNIKKIINWTPPYKIYWCKNCNLIFTYPLPTEKDLNEFYNGYLFAKDRAEKIKRWMPLLKMELSRILNIDHNEDKGKSFLDFGGGLGLHTLAAKNLGLNAFYYELDKSAIKFVKKNFNFGDNIIDNKKRLKKKKFHFILADNVIEHDRNPISFIKFLYSLLHKDGILIIKTPNSRNSELLFYPFLIFTLLKKAKQFNTFFKTIKSFFFRFWPCNPPEHLYAFSKKNLIIILLRLKITKYEFFYHYTPFFKFLYSSRGKLRKLYFIFDLFIKKFKFVLLKLKFLYPRGITLRIKKD